jgi:molybdenum cofactor biosynthesis enzyme MoaA
LDIIAHRIGDKPFDLEFAVTYRCNLRCVQCDIWRYDQENPNKAMEEMDIGEIGRIFSSYGGFRIVGITGGEPFLRGGFGPDNRRHIELPKAPRAALHNHQWPIDGYR